MIANEAPLKKKSVILSGSRFMLRCGLEKLRLNMLPVLLRTVELMDWDMVRLRGREAGVGVPLPLASVSFMMLPPGPGVRY